MSKLYIEIAEEGAKAGVALWQEFADGSRKLIFAGKKAPAMRKMAELIDAVEAERLAARAGGKQARIM